MDLCLCQCLDAAPSSCASHHSINGGYTMWKVVAAVAVLSIVLIRPVQLAAEEAPVSQKSLAEQLVDAFNAVFGVHPGMRANHPKGVVLEGTFTPSPSAAPLTKAAHLQKRKAPIPVTVRFYYGTLHYYGISSFKFTNAKGTAAHVRYQLQALAGDKYLPKERVAGMGPDYL